MITVINHFEIIVIARLKQEIGYSQIYRLSGMALR